MAVFRVRCMNPARGRDIHAFPLLWLHGWGPWACSHRSLDRLRRDWRTGDVHRTFCDAAVQKVPPGRQNVCTSSVGLPRPHQQPKETCPRLIWPLCFDFRAQKWPAGTLRARIGKTLQSASPSRATYQMYTVRRCKRHLRSLLITTTSVSESWITSW